MLDGLAIDSDVFLRFFAHELTGEALPEQARKRVGPHVYLIVSPQRVRYPSGESHVHYIGYTDTPAIRFVAHEKVMPGDGIMMLELLPFLTELKNRIPEWRRIKTRDIAMEMENVFLYLFRRFCGSKPCRNEQEPQPERETQMLCEWVIQIVRDRWELRIGKRRLLAQFDTLRKQLEDLGPAPAIFSPHTTDPSQPEPYLQTEPFVTPEPPVVTPAPVTVRVPKPVVVPKPQPAPSPFGGMSCEEAIIKWFLSRTQRREKVDIREMYDELEGANYSRDAVKRARCKLAKDGVLCQDGAIETYLYRLSDRYR